MVLCGMQNFSEIDASAPMTGAFVQYDMLWVASAINLGAFFGMSTGLLAGVYGQSRIYFALARDELAPLVLKQPAWSSVWCGCVAGMLATFINVRELASLLNIGVLLAYSSTAASILKINSKERGRRFCLGSENFWIALAVLLTFVLSHGGLLSPILPGLAAVGLLGVIFWVASTREYCDSPGGAFKCPGVPVTPMVAVITNTYLASRLSTNAWCRLGVTTIIVTVVLCAVTLRDLERRQHTICETVRAAAAAAGTKPGVCHSCG
mmetsp:Transcript_44452/g.128462  ORF Transcript_44452/g.128462 Transcript_44452/m.128462 type:complete len:265 (-) Transcript_44452:61-855(-)